MADALLIRAERAEDALAIRHVHEQAFPTSAEANLVDALRAAGRLSISLVAEQDGAIIGHVALSPVTLDDHVAPRGLGLGPLAVLTTHQSQGIGGRLIRESLVAASAAAVAFIVVLGEPGYYMRFGFAPAKLWGLQNEYSAGDEFMAQELVPSALPRPAGMVRYATEFAAVAPE